MPPFIPTEKMTQELDAKVIEIKNLDYLKRVEAPNHARLVDRANEAVTKSGQAKKHPRTFQSCIATEECEYTASNLREGEHLYYSLWKVLEADLFARRTGLNPGDIELRATLKRPDPLDGTNTLAVAIVVATFHPGRGGTLYKGETRLNKVPTAVWVNSSHPSGDYRGVDSASEEFMTISDTVEWIAAHGTAFSVGEIATDQAGS